MSERVGSDIQRCWNWVINFLITNRLKIILIQSRSMSDPPLSDIGFKNKMAWVWTTLNIDITYALKLNARWASVMSMFIEGLRLLFWITVTEFDEKYFISMIKEPFLAHSSSQVLQQSFVWIKDVKYYGQIGFYPSRSSEFRHLH